MDLLQLAISKKKEQLSKLENPRKKIKYIRVKDLELIERAEKSNSGENGTTKDTPSNERGNAITREEEKREDGLAIDDKNSTEEDDTNLLYINVSESEILRRFRACGQPVRLFGENDHERLLRLRKIEATEENTEGQHNDYRAALAAAERQLLEENLKGKSHYPSEDSTQVDEFCVNGSSKSKDTEQLDTSIISPELLQSDPAKTCILIGAYFKRTLKEWELYLDSQPEEERRTAYGRQQKAIQAQSTEYMKPFFKILKNRRVPSDVLARISEICKYMQERKYLKANDAYLRLSIGNAPWPIGVTMVGIHERSAREKIFSSQVAHVLNDETQRKWIQSIKRLMTFVQKKYPPEDITMMVG